MPEDLGVATDDDQDAFAAEYVLGTLAADERERAEALRSIDSAFENAVRQWERRLGELNVMVEAVEPPAEVWDKIKTEIGPVEEGAAVALPPEAELPPEEASPPIAEPVVEPEVPISPAAAEILAETPTETLVPTIAPERRTTQRGADTIYLAGRVKRWQRLTFGIGALAALLALYIAVWQVAPGLMPAPLRPSGAVVTAQSQAPARLPDRLVAVLQQGPTAPAFLLTLDTQRRTVVVRRVSAKPEPGKNYELWLISSRLSGPRSLGVIGGDEFTQRVLPGNYDADTLRAATYAVSLEPTGGSPSGAPTGPVLFTGKAVESVPASPPPRT